MNTDTMNRSINYCHQALGYSLSLEGIYMMHKVAMIAMTVGASVASDFAHAGCSGAACSALSPGATYSSSDKKVNVSLTNKDSNQSVHVKFCVTIDGKCNSFDVTLSPHQNIVRNVPVTGTAASPKYTIDIGDAEFVKGPLEALSTPFGRFTYEKTAFLDELKQAVDLAVTAKSQNSQLHEERKKQEECLIKLGASDKTGYIYEGDINKVQSGVQKNSPFGSQSKTAAGVAQSLNISIRSLQSHIRQSNNEADSALTALQITKSEIRALNDRNEAAKLTKEAQEVEEGVRQVATAVKAVVAVATLDFKDATKELAGPMIDAAVEIFAKFNKEAIKAKIDRLNNDADRIQNTNKLKTVQDAFKKVDSLASTISELSGIAADAKRLGADAWKNAEVTYDKTVPKKGFHFEHLDACNAATYELRRLARPASDSADRAYAVIGKVAPLFASSAGTAKSLLSDMRAAVAGYKVDADAIKETAEEDLERLKKLTEAARNGL
jgi:hypothetical protein